MALEFKDAFPAVNTEAMREFARQAARTGMELKPVVGECVAKYPSGRVENVFGRLDALLDMCVDAPATLETRLNVVFTHAAASWMAQAERLKKQNVETPTKMARQAAEYQSDKHVGNTGHAQHGAATEALRKNAAAAKKHEQVHIATEAFQAFIGVFFHQPVLLIEAAKAAGGLLSSSKGNQLKQDLAALAAGIDALENLEKWLEDLCLFLFLVPEKSDLDAGASVTEEVARARLHAAL